MTHGSDALAAYHKQLLECCNPERRYLQCGRPCPSFARLQNASIYAALASSTGFSRRDAVTVLTVRIVAPRAHTIAIRNYPKGWTCLDRGHHHAQLHSCRAALYRCSAARKTIKKGANKKNSSAAAAYRRVRARAGPESHRPPPRRDAAGAGPLRFPRDESTRQRSIRPAQSAQAWPRSPRGPRHRPRRLPAGRGSLASASSEIRRSMERARCRTRTWRRRSSPAGPVCFT